MNKEKLRLEHEIYQESKARGDRDPLGRAPAKRGRKRGARLRGGLGSFTGGGLSGRSGGFPSGFGG